MDRIRDGNPNLPKSTFSQDVRKVHFHGYKLSSLVELLQTCPAMFSILYEMSHAFENRIMTQIKNNQTRRDSRCKEPVYETTH